jgi:hypothetical protein
VVVGRDDHGSSDDSRSATRLHQPERNPLLAKQGVYKKFVAQLRTARGLSAVGTRA